MSGKIFINYRRGDDPGFTGRLFDRLEMHFPPGQLFMDVDSIEPGLDFVRVLDEQVAGCDVLLAVIGRGWLNALDANGNRRIDDQDDFVRIEIESALGRGIRVIPVLVNDADMPREQDLPESLKPFARRNAIRLSHEKFRSDAAGLIKSLAKALEEEAERRRLAEASAAGSAASGLGQIAEAEEIANWEFAQRSKNPFDLRDHLARFPQGKTAKAARERLEAVLWFGLGTWPERQQLEGFLQEFPNGKRAAAASSRLEALKSDRRDGQRIAEWFAFLVLPLLLILALVFDLEDWRLVESRLSNSKMTGIVVGYVAAIGVAGLLVLWRGKALQAREAVYYWLGCALGATFALPALFDHLTFTLDSRSPDQLPLWERVNGVLLGEGAAFVIIAASFVPFLYAARWKPTERQIGVYWLALSFAFTLLVYIALSGFGSGYPLNSEKLGAVAGLAITFASAATLLYLRRETLCGTGVALYWLGCILALLVTTGPLVEWYTWGIGFWYTMALRLGSGWGLGYLALFAVALISAGFLLARRRTEVTRSELRHCWLGCTMTFLVALGCVSVVQGWTFLPSPTEAAGGPAGASGLIVALLLALGVAAIVPIRTAE